ncbi:MAG: leucine-rich repeat domain-containing protein, partial [Clostridia bacterium]|nr:leucine-rich repeat domain-containing protein [Clostridia bacterium]
NNTVETVGENILKGCRVRELTVPATYGHNAAAVEKLTLFGEGEIPANAYQKVTTLKTVDLGGGVKKIGYDAFNALETINLAGVEYMGNNALGNLSTLTCLNIENGLKTLDGWVIAADYSNGGATTLDLSGYTGIYHNAFKKTSANDTSVLTTVILVGSDNTSSIKQIGQRAFEGTGITAVEVPAGIQNWNYAFYGCKSLLNIAIQRGVEKIAGNAFRECTNLSSVNLAASDVEEIDSYAFYNCTALRLVTLPNGIKKIGEYAFSYCSSLMTIDLKGTEEIGERAFSYCSKLSEVTMNSVKKIGGNAFMNCNELTEYDLPVSVTEICGFALSDAQTVNYAGTKEQWEAISKGKDDPWYADGAPIWYRNNDLTIIFADGSSVILPKE